MRRLLAGVRNLVRGRDADRETDAELQSYLDYAAEEYARGGLDRVAADRAARLELGGPAQVAEAVRDARAGARLETFVRDVRFGLRSLRRTPTFTLAAIAVLALGVGANAAIFSVVNATLLRPLPIRDDSRVAVIWIDNPSLGRSRVGPSGQDYLDWTRHSTPFEDLFLFEHGSGTVTGIGEPEQVRGLRVTTNFADFVGTRAIVGRTFVASDSTRNVILLAEGYWQRAFGRDPHVIDRSLTLNGVSYTVIGVLPANACFWYPADVVVPWPLDRLHAADSDLGVFGRLKPSATFASAQAAMTVIATRIAAVRPRDRAGWGILVVPIRAVTVQYIRTALLVLMGAAAFVLLIACANVAGLLIVRALGRRKEVAVRAALGATRGRLVQQVIIEGLLLGSAGGLLGLFAATYGNALLRSVLPGSIPVPAAASEVPLPQAELSLSVVAFTIVISLLISITFSLGPVLACLRGDLAEGLGDGTRATGPGVGTARQRAALIVAEAALAIVLLVGAGLMMRTSWNLMKVRTGFDAQDVTTVQLKFADDAPDSRYRDSVGRVAAVGQFLERVRSIPAVRSAAFAAILPMSQDDQDTGPYLVSERSTADTNDLLTAEFRIVTDGYFETLRIPLKAGRLLTAADGPDTARVVVIDELLARETFGTDDPIGRHLRLGGTTRPPRAIVGVVGGVLDDGLDRRPRPTIYIPYAQAPAQTISLAMRTSMPPAAVLPAVKRAIWSVDPAQPLFKIRRMDEIVSNTVSAQRLAFILLALFAAIALALAAVGMYATTSYAVQQRMHEIAIRTAVGATRSDILRIVIGGGMRHALAGLALGLAAAIALSRELATLLYGVAPLDVATSLAVAVGFAAVACAANAVPAWRAVSVNPADTLAGR